MGIENGINNIFNNMDQQNQKLNPEEIEKIKAQGFDVPEIDKEELPAIRIEGRDHEVEEFDFSLNGDEQRVEKLIVEKIGALLDKQNIASGLKEKTLEAIIIKQDLIGKKIAEIKEKGGKITMSELNDIASNLRNRADLSL